MKYNEWTKRINRGRKGGSGPANHYRTVYRMLLEDGIDIDYKTFTAILRTVADKVWDKLYAGHIIAIPYLFNMEILPNGSYLTKRVDWKRTCKLWSEDNDAFDEKLLVRHHPSRFIVNIKHSTLSRERKRWFWPLMMDIRLNIGRLRDIESKYELQ